MSRRAARAPLPSMTADIEKFSHDGRGIARIEGKTTFVDQALPGERVVFQYVRKKRDFDEGSLLSVVTASPHRVVPRCPHYHLCGGCSLQHLTGDAQIHEKQTLLLDVLARIGRCVPEDILSPLTGKLWHYRNKARLSVRYVEKKQSVLVGFREKNNPRYITEINECPVLHAKVDAALPSLRQLLATFESPHCIAQVEVAAGDDDVALIFRNLSPLSATDEEALRFWAKEHSFRVFLQPKGPASVTLFYPEDAGDFLTYSLPDENITFRFHPTDFTQVNAGLNRDMIRRALLLMDLKPDDVVLDLFCGLGNFSLPMAKHCAKVIGVEGSDAMVARAKSNALLNHIDNTEFFAANLENSNSLSGFERYGISKLLLDPPRAGALEIVKNISVLAPERIVYVSCQPTTLARDADILIHEHGYRMLSAGVMDMFPHTAHVESIAVFEKGR